MVQVDASNFAVGGPLAGYDRTFPATSSGTTTLTQSKLDDRSLDFGYCKTITPQLGSIGDRVWADELNVCNGIQDTTAPGASAEHGVNGVSVSLFTQVGANLVLVAPPAGATWANPQLTHDLPAGQAFQSPAGVVRDGGLLPVRQAARDGSRRHVRGAGRREQLPARRCAGRLRADVPRDELDHDDAVSGEVHRLLGRLRLLQDRGARQHRRPRLDRPAERLQRRPGPRRRRAQRRARRQRRLRLAVRPGGREPRPGGAARGRDLDEPAADARPRCGAGLPEPDRRLRHGGLLPLRQAARAGGRRDLRRAGRREQLPPRRRARRLRPHVPRDQHGHDDALAVEARRPLARLRLLQDDHAAAGQHRRPRVGRRAERLQRHPGPDRGRPDGRARRQRGLRDAVHAVGRAPAARRAPRGRDVGEPADDARPRGAPAGLPEPRGRVRHGGLLPLRQAARGRGRHHVRGAGRREQLPARRRALRLRADVSREQLQRRRRCRRRSSTTSRSTSASAARKSRAASATASGSTPATSATASRTPRAPASTTSTA